MRFAYNQAPDVVYWWLDGHVDFEGAQSDRARDELAAFFRWHRTTQLADYAQLLSRAQVQVMQADPIQPSQVCQWVDDIFARANPIVERAIPQVAGLVPLLTPRQFKHLERKYAKVNSKYRDEYLQKDPADRRDAAVERVVDRAETLYGSLDRAQKDLVTRMVVASPFDPEVWLAERQHRQRDTLATLRSLQAERATPDQVQAGLRALVSRTMRSPREPYRLYDEKLRAYNCGLGAQLHNSTSPKQRQHAVRKLKGWEEDFLALRAQGAGTATLR